MSTLVEIEKAVTALPISQQMTLLEWLQEVVANPSPVTQPKERREAWLQRLAELREHGRTSTSGTPLQQIMDDLRGN
jgi:hypothetical protein